MKKCSQNSSVVYTHPSYEDKELIPYSEIEKFLLNDSIFSPSYIGMNKTLLRFLAFRELPFTLESMVEFIEHKELLKQWISPATVNRRKYHIKKICNELIRANPDQWSMLDQFRLESFFSHINAGSLQKQTIPGNKMLTREETEMLLKRAPSKRWKLIFLFLVTTGVRVSEMVAIIKPKCIKTDKGVLITLTGKRNKQRTITCPAKLFDEICIEFPHRYYLFTTTKGTKIDRRHLWRGANTLSQRILHKPLGVHAFRHSFATQMLQNGIEIKRVSEFLGHSDTKVTNDMYVHLDAISADEMLEFDI